MANCLIAARQAEVARQLTVFLWQSQGHLMRRALEVYGSDPKACLPSSLRAELLTLVLQNHRSWHPPEQASVLERLRCAELSPESFKRHLQALDDLNLTPLAKNIFTAMKGPTITIPYIPYPRRIPVAEHDWLR